MTTLIPKYDQGSANAVNRPINLKLAESVSVLDFIPSNIDPSTTDVSLYINKAISAVNSAGGGSVVVPNGIYLVGVNTIAGIATGVAGIVLLDNVNLVIEGTIKVKNNAYGAGAFYAAIRSLDTGLNNASITGTGIVNGNSSNQVGSVQCSNIYLTCSYNVVVSGISSVYSNGMGIQLVPVANSTHTACAVQNCFINNCTNIGIQIAHSLYCSISGNRITTCTNNGIDIYGDNNTAVVDNGFISITDNNIGGVLVGIFVETSSRVAVVGNTVGFSSTGIATNRISGQPNTITISANSISSCATGMFASGDSGSILISNNSFSVFTVAGLQIGVASGNISYVNAFGNVFSPSATTTPVIYVTGAQASFNIIRQNYLTQGAHNDAYLIVNDATTNVRNTLELPINDIVIQPVKQLYSGTSASGGTATLTLPANGAGKLVIKSVAGGAWESVWAGSFTSNATRVSIAQDSTAFTTPGNSIATVAGSASTLVVTVTFAASGSAGIWTAWIEYF